ncbi:MAG: hypothetical protein IPK97_18285 [Ahniella sp.]|nr:hypothetical protein [Ahniella sp.]
MNSEQWQQVRTLFERAVALPREERIAFIDREIAAQGIDAAMRAQVLALLASDETDPAAARPMIDMALDLVKELQSDSDGTATELPPGTRFGHWELQRELGRGGMGAVYLVARVENDFKQNGALKLIRPGLTA